MNNLKKLSKKFTLNSGTINIILGIIFIISLLVICLHPHNQIAIETACSAGGAMNIMLGYKMMKDPKKKSTGMSYVLLGIIMAFLGFFIVRFI